MLRSLGALRKLENDVSASQRRKGAAGERELAHKLAAALGIHAPKRELDQTREGGCDLKPGNLVVEVKRRKAIAVHEFMDQAVAACDKALQIPVVAMRGDEREWLVMVRLSDLVAFVGEVQFQRLMGSE